MSEERTELKNFITEWLNSAKKANPDSRILQAIINSTQDDKLNEANLLKELFNTINIT